MKVANNTGTLQPLISYLYTFVTETETETNTAEEDKLLHTLQTIGHLSNKASRRVYSNVIRYLSTVKKEVLLKDYVRRLVEFLHLTSYLQCENITAKESKQVQTNGEIKENKRKSELEDKRETEPEENSNIEKEKHEWDYSCCICVFIFSILLFVFFLKVNVIYLWK